MNIYEEIEKLVVFSEINGLIETDDKILVRNRILEILDLDSFEEVDIDKSDIKKYEYPCEILDNITSWAGENSRLKENILVYKDLLNSKIMGQIIKMPSEVNKIFSEKYKENPELATEFFYDLSQKSNYIRTDRISKNICYKYNS